ncbi:MAG: sugar ABC transporter permease [Firmicutes bacterium]|nr:sugar ABC transporter permease [Bacillota bacterium]
MTERRTMARNREETVTALICLLPALLVFGLFNIYPALYAAWLSLVKWDGLSTVQIFVGFTNYRTLLADPEFWNSARVTLLYTIGVTVLGLAAGLTVALVLNQRLFGRTLYRAIYFTPVITASVAAGVVWSLLFDPISGMVNLTLKVIGLQGPDWLGDPKWALPAVTLVGIWKRLGFNMVIYLAGLQAIPREYDDAAKVDGASSWQRFRHITWPLLMPTTVLLAIMSVIDAFQAFDHIFVMTFGGPMGATDVLPLYLYRQGFRLFHLGYASAVGWVIFLLVFITTLLQWRFSRFGGWQRA